MPLQLSGTGDTRQHITADASRGPPFDGVKAWPRGGGGKHRLYDVDISLKNLRHHWNACSRTSAAGVSDLPSVIHSSAACAVHSNLAGARDIERRAVPKGAMPAVPPPAWKLGFDKPCRSVNRACHTGGDRAKCTLELAVELRRANRDSLDSVQKFPQVHFSHPPGSMVRIVLQLA